MQTMYQNSLVCASHIQYLCTNSKWWLQGYVFNIKSSTAQIGAVTLYIQQFCLSIATYNVIVMSILLQHIIDIIITSRSMIRSNYDLWFLVYYIIVKVRSLWHHRWFKYMCLSCACQMDIKLVIWHIWYYIRDIHHVYI